MNRRQFTASLGAAVAAPALPLGKIAAVAAPSAASNLPHGAYMWADLIARARGHVDAGFLARQLRLDPADAAGLVQELVAREVVSAPGLGGVARAIHPIRLDAISPGAGQGALGKAKSKLRDLANDLVKPEKNTESTAPENDTSGNPDPSATLSSPTPETGETTDASPDQSLQTSPQKG